MSIPPQLPQIPVKEEVWARVQRALHQLYKDDRFLIDVDANERSLTHRLAVYLEEQFPGWNVDCEYNRVMGNVKRIAEVEHQLRAQPQDEDLVRDTQGRTVYPDIIIHVRGQEHNLLLIEAKKASSSLPDEVDRLKIEALLHQDQYRYRYGILLTLPVGPDATVPDFEII